MSCSDNKEGIKLLLHGYLPNNWPNDLYHYFMLYLYTECSFVENQWSKDLIFSDDMLTVTNNSMNNWKTARASIILVNGQYTFTIKLIKRANNMIIGIIPMSYIIDKPNAYFGDIIGSYGLDIYGDLFEGHSDKRFNNGYRQGDIIKCVVNISNKSNSHIIYYVNGKQAGNSVPILYNKYHFAISILGYKHSVMIIQNNEYNI